MLFAKGEVCDDYCMLILAIFTIPPSLPLLLQELETLE